MGGFKHLVVVRLKEDTVVDEILKGIEKLVSEVEAVKSFEWGEDIEGPDMLRQGKYPCFLDDIRQERRLHCIYEPSKSHRVSATISAAIDKIVVLDFPSVLAKAPA